MLSISATEEWRLVHAGGNIGLLELSGVDNRGASAVLDSRKRALELQLRTAYKGFSREDLLGLPVLAAYREYYRQFKKTYHVQLQLESIVQKYGIKE